MAEKSYGMVEIHETIEAEKSQVPRNSTGKLNATTKGVEKHPNYLRASTGSCHDVCKYGTPHEFRAKPRRPVKRRSITKAEIPVEILVPSDKRSIKMAKPSSTVADVLESTKLEDVFSGRPPSICAPKPIRQQESSSTKVRSSHITKPIGRETKVQMKSSLPHSSNSVKQKRPSDVKSLANSVKREPSLDVKSPSPDSSNSAKQEPSSDVKSQSPDSSRKVSLSQRCSSNASKSNIQDAQSRRKPSSSEASGSTRRIVSKHVTSSSHLTSGSVSKTSLMGRKSSLPDASKSVKQRVVSSNDKAPLKQTCLHANRTNTATKLGGSLKLKSHRASIEQSSSPNLSGRTSGNGLCGRRTTGSKVDNDLRTSSLASKKNMVSPTASLSLKTRKNPKIAVKSIPTSSTIALTPNLPGTEVASLNVTKNITQKEGSRNPEGTFEDLNGYSDSKKPDNEKVPEKTLHVIEVETDQQSPGSAHKGSNNIQSQFLFSPESLGSLCQTNSPFSTQDAVETTTESEYTDSEADDSISLDDNDAVKMTGGQNTGTPRKSRVLEENEKVPVKLKFRRGKVIDPQSEINSPRRLRFRRRRALGNDQGVNYERRRSFKGKDVDGNTVDKNPDGVNVVLRHQDVQQKKSDQGLLNIVIEETASKLVETRKSKVKALVGAFETVISLQESKSPPGDKPSPHSSPGR